MALWPYRTPYPGRVSRHRPADDGRRSMVASASPSLTNGRFGENAGHSASTGYYARYRYTTASAPSCGYPPVAQGSGGVAMASNAQRTRAPGPRGVALWQSLRRL